MLLLQSLRYKRPVLGKEPSVILGRYTEGLLSWYYFIYGNVHIQIAIIIIIKKGCHGRI